MGEIDGNQKVHLFGTATLMGLGIFFFFNFFFIEK